MQPPFVLCATYYLLRREIAIGKKCSRDASLEDHPHIRVCFSLGAKQFFS
jgi:hypothetical protein